MTTEIEVKVIEMEVARFWSLMGKFGAEMTLREFVDELDLLAIKTQSPALREMCLRAIRRYAGGSRAAGRAGAEA